MTLQEAKTRMIDDSALRSDVEDELEWDPAVPTTCIGVSATDHTITLSGTVHTLAHRLAAVRAARRVRGVHAIVDDITVVPVGDLGATDAEIGIAVERNLESSTVAPAGIKATVRDGLVTLFGTVDFQYQKSAVQRGIRDIKGVTWVQNNIVVKAQAASDVVRSKIVGAMHRNADLEAEDIHVAAKGHEVWLSGNARSLSASVQAELAAWSAPGVEKVHNSICIR